MPQVSRILQVAILLHFPTPEIFSWIEESHDDLSVRNLAGAAAAV
jgi:hypothetical protein